MVPRTKRPAGWQGERERPPAPSGACGWRVGGPGRALARPWQGPGGALGPCGAGPWWASLFQNQRDLGGPSTCVSPCIGVHPRHRRGGLCLRSAVVPHARRDYWPTSPACPTHHGPVCGDRALRCPSMRPLVRPLSVGGRRAAGPLVHHCGGGRRAAAQGAGALDCTIGPWWLSTCDRLFLLLPVCFIRSRRCCRRQA